MTDFADLVAEHTPSEIEDALTAFDMVQSVALAKLIETLETDPVAAAIGTPAEITDEMNKITETVAYLQFLHQVLFTMRIRVEEAPE